MAIMNDILAKIERLPAMPATVLQMTAMLSSGRANLTEIEAVAKRDEAVSVAILRYANSVRYGRAGRIFNLKESIVRLGGRMLMKIVIQHNVGTLFRDAGAAYGLSRGALWRGALGGALAAEQIAHRVKFDDPELCFLCGLLRDVGKLALDSHFGQRYLAHVSEHLRPNRTFVEAERAAMSCDHAQLGAELAIRWGLPVRIADAIRYHHEPPAEGARHDTLFDIVHAGDIICLWAGLAVGHDGLQYKLAEHVRLGLRLDRREAESEIAHVWTRLRELEAFMNESSVQEKTA